MTRTICLLVASAVTIVGCSPVGAPERVRPRTGAPTVESEAARRHADQFETDVPVRRAGSQEEAAAATYLLGHLQAAGYSARLDAVPVEDLVRSTNVLTIPPDDGVAPVLVAVVYDTGPSPGRGRALGLWLELARAAAVAGGGDPPVRFAALGAEHAQTTGGHLGSRRLAQVLLDRGEEPGLAILLSAGDAPAAGGSFGARFRRLANDAGVHLKEGPLPAIDVEAAAILGRVASEELVVSGPPEMIGPLLLDLIFTFAG